MEKKANRLFHPVFTIVLWIKLVLVSLVFVVVSTVFVEHFVSGQFRINDIVEFAIALSIIMGTLMMLKVQKIGFYLIVIPYLVLAIDSLFHIPNPMAIYGTFFGFGQIALLLLLMRLSRDEKNAYHVLWGKDNVAVEVVEESLKPELNEEPGETPRNPQGMRLKEVFKGKKPLIGMIHTNHTDGCTTLELAQKEIEVYLRHGIYPLIENYFGSTKDCENILAWMQKEYPEAIYGVNILGDYTEAFRLAKEYGASFIQIDSVCGHLMPKSDEEYAEQLSQLRKDSNAVLLGGVRFKYQPVLSGRSLEEDLKLGAERCDAIVCTGEGTGQPTPFDKVREFKSVLNDFPVIVGAGVTIDTIGETFDLADGAIVGSWFKEEHRDCCNVKEEYVRQMTENLK